MKNKAKVSLDTMSNTWKNYEEKICKLTGSSFFQNYSNLINKIPIDGVGVIMTCIQYHVKPMIKRFAKIIKNHCYIMLKYFIIDTF